MRPAFVVALCALLAGCGADSSDRPTRQATAEAAASATTSARTGDEAEVAALAEKYLSAFAAEDWSIVCATRSETERRELARTAGSCERAFEVIVKNRPGAAQLFADARAGDVRIRGRIAGVDIVQPGQTEPATTLAAVKRDGEWLLEDTPDGKTP